MMDVKLNLALIRESKGSQKGLTPSPVVQATSLCFTLSLQHPHAIDQMLMVPHSSYNWGGAHFPVFVMKEVWDKTNALPGT